MAKKWIALNILLLAAAFWLARELNQRYERYKAESSLVRIEAGTAENQAGAKAGATDVSADVFAEAPVHRDSDYYVISERTLFSDARGAEDTTLSTVLQVIPPLNPRPILVGTVMLDGEYVASVIDPTTQQARNGQVAPETRRIGDVYRGYQITSIEAEQMVLENGGRREVIPLNRSARRTVAAAKPASTAGGATRVVPIGPGGSRSGLINVVTVTAAAGRTTAPQQTAAQQTAAQQAAARQAQQQQQQQQAQQQQQQNQRTAVSSTNSDLAATQAESVQATATQAKQQSKPAQKPQAIDAQTRPEDARQRVIRSPFGDITRPGME